MNKESEILKLQNKINEVTHFQKELVDKYHLLNSLIDKQPGYAYRVKYNKQRTPIVISEGIVLITGYSHSEYFEGNKILHHTEVSKVDRELVRISIEECALAHLSYEIMYRIATAIGAEKWIWDRGHGIFDEKGELIEIEGFATEVTKLKKGEEVVRESEYRFRTIFESSNDAIMILKEKGYIDCNQKSLEMFGIEDKKEFLNSHPAFLSPPYQPNGRESFPFANEIIVDALKTGTKRFEWMHRRSNGEVFPTNVLLSPFKFKDEWVLHVTVRDITLQKQAEEQILKLSKGIEQSPVSVIITNLKGDIEYVNPRFSLVTGYSFEEVIGKNPRILKSGNKTLEDYQNIWGNLTSGEVWRGEFLNRKKNGDLYWESSSISPIKNAKGEVTHYIAVKEDITERKKETERLIESEARFKHLADTAPVLIWMSGIDKLCFYFNKVWLDFTGRTHEQEYGNGWAEGVHPDDLDRCIDIYVSSFDKRETFSMEYRLKHHTGEYRWLMDNGSPRYLENGEFIGYIGSCTDITEMKNTQAELQFNKERWQFAVEGSNDGLWDWNLETNEVYFSPRWKTMLGFEVDEIENKLDEWSKRVHPEDLDFVYKEINKHIEGESEFYLSEHRVICKDGSFKWILDRGKIVSRDADGKPIRMIGTHTDITESKIVEKALKDSEAIFKNMFEKNTTILLLIDPETQQIVDSNEAALEFYGYSKATLCSMKISDINQLNPEEIKTEMSYALTEKREYFVFPHKISNGEIKIVEVHSSPLEIENKKLLVSLIHDITSKVEAENELVLLRRSVESSVEGIIITGNAKDDFPIVYVNEAFATITGYTKEEVLGKNCRFMKGPKTDSNTINLVKNSINQSETIEVEVLNYKKDGTEFWNYLRITPIYNNKGIATHFVGFQNDITAKKLVEEYIKTQFNILSKHAEQVPGVIYQFQSYPDGKSRFPYASKGIWDIYEVTPEEVINDASKVFSRLHKEDFEGVVESINLSMSTLENWVDEYRVELPSKGIRWLRGLAKPERKSDGSTLWHGYISDITDRKLAEEAIKESEQIQKTIFRVAPIPLIVSKIIDGKILVVNEAMEKLLCLSKKELLQKNTIDFYADTEERNNLLKVLNKEGRITNYEIRLYDGLQNQKICLVSIEIIEMLGEKVLLSGFLEITRRKLIEEEIQNLLMEVMAKNDLIEAHLVQKNALIDEIKSANLKLEEAIKEKDKFFSIIAHDLKSPFSGFLGLTEVIVNEFDDLSLKELQEYSASMKTSAENLFGLLENLLEWSRMERGIVNFQPSEIPLKYLVHNNIDILGAKAEMKQISLEENISDSLFVYADVYMLNGLLRNLLSNSLKFTPRGGKVSINAISENEFIRVSITDTGIGIPQDMIDKLFIASEKTSRKGTEDESSTGLGLLLCKDYVEKNEGKIWAESEEGKGSTFHFTIKKSIEKMEEEI